MHDTRLHLSRAVASILLALAGAQASGSGHRELHAQPASSPVVRDGGLVGGGRAVAPDEPVI
ncbi:MAG: hypothetical protein JW741_12335 [Sedimentisphaerales bacterium]|nr:hypothetical protein [Sedimentisphaerales bacterium]